MNTIKETVASIQKNAASHDNGAKFLRVAAPIRQGDLYLTPIDELPAGASQVTTRQLAPGTSKGSRHTAEGTLDVYEVEGRGPLDGPVVVAKQRWKLTHPEHADIDMPSGNYQCRYQQDREREELARVMD